MAHVSSERVMAEMGKGVCEAGSGAMMGKGMMMGPMMGEMMDKGMMGPMMEGMPMARGTGMLMGGAATGAAISATGRTGKSLLKSFFEHPVVLIGLGVAVGFLVHKYRKEIVAAATRTTSSARGGQESLEDLVAETKESAA